ncbi:MAG: hypothetical protein JWQ98_1062 [Chlorobi bacterium]|nr:hypothetical protein [Chlorobiota bacterium]
MIMNVYRGSASRCLARVLMLMGMVAAAWSMMNGCGEYSPARGLPHGGIRSSPQAHATINTGTSVDVTDRDTIGMGDTATAGTNRKRRGIPGSVVPVTVPEGSQADLLSLPLSFDVSARAMGHNIELHSDKLSNSVGLACFGGTSRDAALTISRFAQFGRLDSPYTIQWVVFMDNEGGELTARPRRSGSGGFDISLRGRLYLNVIFKGASVPIRMATRSKEVLEGHASSWPPYGAVLHLAARPLLFYHERNMADTAAPPLVTVTEASLTFGQGASAYFTKPPRITRTLVFDTTGSRWSRGKIGGVHLEWSNSTDSVRPVPIAGYDVYRTFHPTDPGSWSRIAQLPPSQTSLDDRDYDGRITAYRIAHRTLYPTGYTYEGGFAPPLIIGSPQR